MTWMKGWMMDEAVDVRRVERIGLPAIFRAFFWLGVTSFGGGTAG
jgi:chromate transport protein ChrA